MGLFTSLFGSEYEKGLERGREGESSPYGVIESLTLSDADRRDREAGYSAGAIERSCGCDDRK